MFDACEKNPAFPDTDDRLVDDAAEAVAFVLVPDLSSSRSLSLWNSLLSNFCLSFSCSTDSTVVTALLRFTKFAVPIKYQSHREWTHVTWSRAKKKRNIKFKIEGRRGQFHLSWPNTLI